MHVYEEFKEYCDHINMKYGLQVENLMKDFNQIMQSKRGEEIMQKVNAMWSKIRELEGELDEQHDMPRRVEKVFANHYVDVEVYREFKKHCDNMDMKYGFQVENLIRDFNLIMWTKGDDEAMQKVKGMWSRAQERETELLDDLEYIQHSSKV